MGGHTLPLEHQLAEWELVCNTNIPNGGFMPRDHWGVLALVLDGTNKATYLRPPVKNGQMLAIYCKDATAGGDWDVNGVKEDGSTESDAWGTNIVGYTFDALNEAILLIGFIGQATDSASTTSIWRVAMAVGATEIAPA